jgi:hypothetical protein
VSIQDDPLLPSLLEIVTRPEAQGVIVTGGLGMLLKRAHLNRLQTESGTQITLIPSLPEVRVTQDIDLVLRIDLWLDINKAMSFAAMLSDLGYQQNQFSWQFRKSLPDVPYGAITLDLQSRSPRTDEAVKVKRRSGVTQVGKDMGAGIAGRQTPEAFAIDDMPISVPVEYHDQIAAVLIPHPYAWLNLKIRAAYDWLGETRGEIRPKKSSDGDASRRLKHVYDVYALIAMITEQELNESFGLSEKFSAHTEALASKIQAIELFGKEDAQGTIAASSNARQLGTAEMDYQTFWDALTSALGIARS